MDPKSTSDLTSLVAKILAHPELVEQISSLLGENENPPAMRVATEGESEESEPIAQETASAIPRGTDKQENRKRLLTALRPFLSERRSRALDSVETVATLFDLGGR